MYFTYGMLVQNEKSARGLGPVGGKFSAFRSWTNTLADVIAGRIAWKMFSNGYDLMYSVI